MAQARCFGAGDLSDDHSFKELLGKWGRAPRQARPLRPVAHPTHPQEGQSPVSRGTGHPCVLPPPPRPRAFEEEPKLLSLTRSPLGPRNPSGPLSPLSP